MKMQFICPCCGQITYLSLDRSKDHNDNDSAYYLYENSPEREHLKNAQENMFLKLKIRGAKSPIELIKLLNEE